MPSPAESHLDAAATLLAERDEATVVSAMSPQQPDRLLSALVAIARQRAMQLTLVVADLTGRFGFLDEDSVTDLRSGRLRIVTLAGSVPRRLSHLVEHVPNSLWDVDRMLGAGDIPADVFVARVSAARGDGAVGLGDMVGYTPSVLGTGVLVGFELVPGRVFAGTEPIPAARAEVLCAGDRPASPPPAPARAPTAQQREIARLVAGLVPDGATVQLGLGAIPEAVIAALAGKQDLGLHSGIFPASMRRLLADGVVTGALKSADEGLHIATGILDDDPLEPAESWGSNVMLQPIAITHAPDRLLRHERLWAINSAFEVDLAGQVNAEYAAGVRVASGGGQADFIRAAHASPGGASVLALPARTKSGGSRIVGSFGEPYVVTSRGNDVDFVVTEYGVAELRGATAGERARRLIEIAHPEDREPLRRARTARAESDRPAV